MSGRPGLGGMSNASCGVQPTQTGPLEGAVPPSLCWLVAPQAGIADVYLTRRRASIDYWC
jgi:hypothetical protein